TTQREYGLPEDDVDEPPTDSSPSEVSEILGINGGSDTGLGKMMAVTTRIVQTRKGVDEENGYVPVREVDEELRKCYEVEDVDEGLPDYETLADIRRRSPLLDVDLDENTDEIVIRLTDDGEETVEEAMETGDVQSAGGTRHDEVLERIHSELTKLGFTVGVLEQDSSEQTDARAFYSDEDTELEFNVEVETTTPDKPAKVLENLRKAQEEERIPLFVVEAEETAERVENILNSPIKREENGEVYYYTTDDWFRFNGGEKGGVAAVRPSGDNGTRIVWSYDRNDDELVLRDRYNGGEEHLRIDDVENVSQDSFPAVFSYNPREGEYTVYQNGESRNYTDEEEFKEDWTPVRRPFVPEVELPISRFESDTYVIVIAPEQGDSVVYDGGDKKPLEILIESPPRHATDGHQERDELVGIDESSVGAFASRFLTERQGATIIRRVG
ncbi:MAG: conjugal transfer protein, partial [Halobacteria archaeon]|nr:conjugal transfer protein [Halobacteria archaeon]